MRTVTVDKADLIQSVSDNRRAHVDTYNEAYAAYVVLVEDWLHDTHLAWQAGNHEVKLLFQHAAPVSHEDDYERTLRMLSMSVDETIELTEPEFAQYVMDDWGWKREWNASNTTYLLP